MKVVVDASVDQSQKMSLAWSESGDGVLPPGT